MIKPDYLVKLENGTEVLIESSVAETNKLNSEAKLKAYAEELVKANKKDE